MPKEFIKNFSFQGSSHLLFKRQFRKAILCSKHFEIPLRERQYQNVLLLKASFLKNIEVEAVILLFIIDFLSFWPLRQCTVGRQKPRENSNVN